MYPEASAPDNGQGAIKVTQWMAPKQLSSVGFLPFFLTRLTLC